MHPERQQPHRAAPPRNLLLHAEARALELRYRIRAGDAMAWTTLGRVARPPTVKPQGTRLEIDHDDPPTGTDGLADARGKGVRFLHVVIDVAQKHHITARARMASRFFALSSVE